ncbi:MAG: MerR family transcriptional regulator [Mucispirillum sp.]|nr:MerR family transcriptional regulator [Mucispirillum sp.]
MDNRFYKIGEAAKLVDIPASTIRYWEKEFRQLKPVKSTGGQRFYTSEHIVLLRQLKEMLHKDKYTIEGAKNKLKENAANKSGDAENERPEESGLPLTKDELKREIIDIIDLLKY